jgi:VanZ family protein
MTMQNLARAAAWFMLAAIILLSVVPPGLRPVTRVPHTVEHASIFLFDGLVFGIAYFAYLRCSIISAVVLCAGVELLQLIAPGRHARLSDFIVDASAACLGLLAGQYLIRIRQPVLPR